MSKQIIILSCEEEFHFLKKKNEIKKSNLYNYRL